MQERASSKDDAMRRLTDSVGIKIDQLEEEGQMPDGIDNSLRVSELRTRMSK